MRESKERKETKMNDLNFVESAMSELLILNQDSRLTLSLRDQIAGLLSGLRFLELYAQCLTKWNEALQGKKNRHLGSVRNPQIKPILGGATKGLFSTGIRALETQNFQDWDNLASNLLGKIQLSKPNIEKDCLDLLGRTFQCRFSSYELQKFFRNLSSSLDELIRLKSEKVVDIKMQIQGMKERLHLFAQIFELSRKLRSNNKDLKDFIIRIQAWTYYAACLSLLYWVWDEHQEEEILPGKIIFLSTPEVTRMFLAVLKFLWSSSHNRLLIDEGVPRFVDFLLEILQMIPPKGGIQNLHTELMFLTTFLVDPPMAKDYRADAELIAIEVRSLLCSPSASQLKGGIAEERDIFLHDFLEKMDAVNEKVRELFAHIFLDSSSFDFPRTDVMGFLDALLDNLNEISLHVSNLHVEILKDDLLSLRPFLGTILKSKMGASEDLRRRIINAVYHVEIAINKQLYLGDCVWYEMKCLSHVRDEVNLIKSEVEKIQNQPFRDISASTFETTSIHSQANMSRMDGVDEFFQYDIETIVDQLTRYSSKLGIISIVGMPGQGKTTLAKMIYNHSQILSHFHVRAWSCVSQSYQHRKLLLDILSHLALLSRKVVESTNEQLSQILYQSLKGRRYLIVLDDVWDIGAWNALRYSFPDDNNGSRILFTSRIDDLAFQTGLECFTRPLHPLPNDESWILLRWKVFNKHPCPPIFADVGREIVKNCYGSRLSIAVIAGLLLSGETYNLSWWEHIANNLGSLVDRQEMSIAEISYTHLPEYLKPCFLYFGAFQEDQVIKVRRLSQLWISEGFVHNSPEERLEDMAEKYLNNLVSRNLIAVTNRSSTGKIKSCRIHNLLYEFCLKRGKEESFLRVNSGNDLFSDAKGAIYKNYRICIQAGGDGFFASNPTGHCVHSLLFMPDHTCLNKGELFSICNFTLLQTLDLEDMEFKSYFPEEVTLLVLLRYLAIWCPSGILSIPPSIASLRRLETFRIKRDLRFGEEIFLPLAVWTMKRLRHVDVGGFTASVPGDSEPGEESSALVNIQSFSVASICYGEDAEKMLRRIPNVQKLRCRFRDSHGANQNENHFPRLDFLILLESLNLRYVGDLFYPRAFSLPATLTKLTLAKFKLPWWEMSTLSQNLPNLLVLKLLEDAFDGKVWHIGGTDFPKLKFLKLRELNVAKITGSIEDFPCLAHLIVESCDELEELPSMFADLPTLRRIQVRWCKSSVANSVRKIREETLDYWGDDFLEARAADIFLDDFENDD